jgi:tRNA threonylcarbamoyladenosine biosynthesis protein TsaB
MRVLSLDTTTRAGSVALVDAGRIVEERSGDPSRTHAERLPGEMIALLDAHRWTLADVELFAVASGPGSFTGLRIGIATIQGAAFVHQRRIAAVSALEALAHAASTRAQPGDFIGAWIDAHRHDVFSALYRVNDAELFEAGRVSEIEGPQVGPPAEALERWRLSAPRTPLPIVGDGAVLYAELVATPVGSGDPAARVVQPTPLLAGAIGLIALARARAGTTVEAAGVQPLYVRRPDAEVAREKNETRHKGHQGKT